MTAPGASTPSAQAAPPRRSAATARPRLLLALASALFLAALGWQRCTSGFLRVESRAALGAEIAREAGLPLSEVLALHELLGAELPAAAWRASAAELAQLRAELGDVRLGVLALRGQRALAERLADAATSAGSGGGGDDPLRPRLLAAGPAAQDAVRFAAVAQRYRARGH